MNSSLLDAYEAKIVHRIWFTKYDYYSIEVIILSPKQCKELNQIWLVPILYKLKFS